MSQAMTTVAFMATIGQRMTADEFLQITDEWPPMELIDGEIVVNEPSPRHQRICLHLAHRLYSWVEAAPGRGEVSLPTDRRLDDRTVLSPDVWWSPDGWSEPSPAIVIEVRSDSTWRYDVGVKRDRYLAAGAVEVWLVDTKDDVVRIGDRVLTVDDALTSPLLPGFTLSVRELFDR